MKKRKYEKRILAVIIWFTILMQTVLPVLAKEALKTVKVGFFELQDFYEKDSFGNYTGYAVDYLNNIAENAGWNLEYVESESFEEALKNFREGKTDILAPCQITVDRLNKFSFPAYPMGTEYGAILTLNTKDNLVYEDFSKFGSIKIGCVPTLVFYDDFITYAEENGFDANIIYYKDTPTLINALNSGEVDAIVGNLMIKTDSMKLLGQFGANSYYFMMQREAEQLLSEMNSAINSIRNENPGFEANLERQYFKEFSQIPISKNEQDYVNEIGTMTIGYVQNYAPISYTDKDGNPAGITIDILNAVSKVSGIKFQYVELPMGEITYDYLRDNKIKLVSNVELNTLNKNANGLLLTEPYISAKKVFVMKSGEEFDESKKYTLALATGSKTIAQVIEDEFPNVTISTYDTIEESFKAVESGKADLLLQNQYVIEPFLSKPSYSNLSVVPLFGIEDKLCLSVIQNQDNNELLDERLISVINKSLSQISEDEISGIVIKEMAKNQYVYSFSDFLYLYKIWIIVFSILILSAVVLLICIWRMKKRNSEFLLRANVDSDI